MDSSGVIVTIFGCLVMTMLTGITEAVAFPNVTLRKSLREMMPANLPSSSVTIRLPISSTNIACECAPVQLQSGLPVNGMVSS